MKLLKMMYSLFLIILFIPFSCENYEGPFINGVDTLWYSSENFVDIPDREQNIIFKLRNDTLNISGYIEANCCGEHFLIIRKTNDSIIMTRLDTGDLCDCHCALEINVNIYDCKSESYRLILKEYLGSDGIDTLVNRNNTFINNLGYNEKNICYPNPMEEYATIEFYNSENKPFTFILTDINGKIIEKKGKITSDRIKY